ncbi:hypothetical protein H2200_010966 [Cladophialophora chaetospira]|uniref:ATP-dependent DNA ligase family profile domain-containing protein n=1 Tax=Cladophialophora chaetospira TaxID=386627 RepID=A0AA39CE12_9EURO|nr:hypothetical protein H2200_010966 [Cladophialophora chaetospira]
MSFKFRYLVNLLEDLDAARERSQNAVTSRQPFRPKPKAQQQKPKDQITPIIKKWFAEHESDIVRHGPSAAAFLSCLLPDQLPHRVYGLKEKSLASLLCKVLFLPVTGRGQLLHEWNATGHDFATCVSLAMSQAEYDPPNSAEHEVTLEEVDETLKVLAMQSRFSPEAYQKSSSDEDLVARERLKSENVLRHVMRRLQSYEAKWLVRMILKSYSPLEIPLHLVLDSFHFLLPDIFPLRSSIPAAVEVLGKPDIMRIPHNPPTEHRYRWRQDCVAYITPKLGVLIRRQEFKQARSLAHCCTEARGRTMSVDRKYDGYYCQIHIDVSPEQIKYKIISKSGKDQTANWTCLHRPIEFGLQLKEEDCPLKGHCILEAEALIWDGRDRVIQPFCKLRKYFEYHGRTIGAEADSPSSIHDSPMLVYYDCLFLDGQSLIGKPHRERRRCLEQIIKIEEGLVHLGDRRVINFSSSSAKVELLEYFEDAIRRRWEGFVLKGSDDPYFTRGGWSSGIKLKPDYLKGLGDHADLCIVGAHRDATEAKRLGGSLKCTHFYLACLTNKEGVRNSGSKPEFLLLDVLTSHNMSKETLKELNLRARDYPLPFAYQSDHYDVHIDQSEMKKSPPKVLFTKPFVVEVTSARFEKPQNASYYSPRFPRDLKLHSDRSFVETHSFEELQNMAEESFKPVDPEEQAEIDAIRQKLIEADPKRYQMVDWHRQVSQSPSCASTASPDKSMSDSSPSKPALLSEPPTSPLTDVELKGPAVAAVAAAGFGDDDSHSPSTASPSPPAAAPIPSTEHRIVKMIPAFKRSATAPEQGTKRKHEPGRSGLSPENAKFLRGKGYKGPLDDRMAIAMFRIQNGLIPNKVPQTTTHPPTKDRRRATYDSPRKPRPLAELPNVSLTRGLEKVDDSHKPADKRSIAKRRVAREHPNRNDKREIDDLTSPDKDHPAAGPALKEASRSNSTPALAMQSPPGTTGTMKPLSTPSRALDSVILRVLQEDKEQDDPLVDLWHISDYEVIYVKLCKPDSPKVSNKLKLMAIKVQRRYKTLPIIITQKAPTQRRMIFFVNNEARPSMLESSPLTKTPRQIMNDPNSKARFCGALLMSVDAGGVDVRCQAFFDKFDALVSLETLRMTPDQFVVSPRIGTGDPEYKTDGEDELEGYPYIGGGDEEFEMDEDDEL